MMYLLQYHWNKKGNTVYISRSDWILMPFGELIWVFIALAIQILQCCHVVHHTTNVGVVSAWRFSVYDSNRFFYLLLSPSIYQRFSGSKLNSAWRYVEQGRIKLLAFERRSLGIPALLQHFVNFLKQTHTHTKKKHRKLSAVQPIHWLYWSVVFVTLPARGSGAFLAVSVGNQRWGGPTRRAPLRPQWPWSARGWSDLRRFLVHLSAQQSTTLPRIYSETANRNVTKWLAVSQINWTYVTILKMFLSLSEGLHQFWFKMTSVI